MSIKKKSACKKVKNVVWKKIYFFSLFENKTSRDSHCMKASHIQKKYIFFEIFKVSRSCYIFMPEVWRIQEKKNRKKPSTKKSYLLVKGKNVVSKKIYFFSLLENNNSRVSYNIWACHVQKKCIFFGSFRVFCIIFNFKIWRTRVNRKIYIFGSYSEST